MKKFIDRDGRVFGKISVVDLLVLAFLILAGVSLYLKLNVLDTTQTVQPPAPSGRMRPVGMPSVSLGSCFSTVMPMGATAAPISSSTLMP